jgi:diguanylate cyclase (GGDEF)-like protein/PAS domain S-box-containing protein
MLVTEQMQGESEELLRSFIDQAPVPIAMFDREMRYIAASRRWVSDYGFNDKSWRGASHYEMFPDLPSRWLAIHRRALYGEVVMASEDRFDRADGSVQWLRWEVRPWYHDHEQGGVIIFAEDVTGQKTSENRVLKLSEELEQRVSERTARLEETITRLRTALTEADQLRMELREQTIRDPLTGLFNRRFLEESMKHELAYARRTNSSLGVVMLDMDKFKQLNDTHGHEAGDEVLRNVARLLLAHVRAGDVACRYGGDEFIILMPGATLEATLRKARQLGEQVKTLPNAICSTGVASDPEPGTSGEALLRAADTALYRAKAEGGVRVAAS